VAQSQGARLSKLKRRVIDVNRAIVPASHILLFRAMTGAIHTVPVLADGTAATLPSNKSCKVSCRLMHFGFPIVIRLVPTQLTVRSTGRLV
jgi:hypothetical protein